MQLDAQRAQSGQIQEQPEAEAEAGGRSDTGARPLAQSSPAAAANDDGAWGDASPQMQRQNSVATSAGPAACSVPDPSCVNSCNNQYHQ